MSAVMSTLSIISGGRRATHKLAKKRTCGQYSDAGEEAAGAGTARRLRDAQRSASLQTLETRGGGGGEGEAGVGQLESLEAKMASIEVSLSARGGRRAGGGGGALASPASPASRELDSLRAALRDKDSLILNLKEQLSSTLNINRISASLSRAGSPGAGAGAAGAAGMLTTEERRGLEERAAATRREADERRLSMARLRQTLDTLQVTDNIDSHIRQAELEYRLGREELELLSLAQQARALQLLLDRADCSARTLYSCVREMAGATLATAEVEDSAGARLRLAPCRAGGGVVVEWSGCGDVRPGDRLVEVNGVCVAWSRGADEAWRALAACRPARLLLLRPPAASPAGTAPQTSPPQTSVLRAELGALREQAGEARRAKEGLRADNLRLTHRISYLEEQVAELLARDQVQVVTTVERTLPTASSARNVTSINIGGDRHPDLQVFQKGPDITALVSGVPGAPAAAAVRTPRRSLDTYALHHSRSAHSLDQRRDAPDGACRPPRMRHASSHACVAGAERAHYADAGRAERRPRAPDEDARHIANQSDGELARIKKTNWAEKKTLAIIEQLKQTQRSRRSRRERQEAAAAAADCSSEPGGGAAEGARGEARGRPLPPRKPLRLSLHRAHSEHSVESEGADGAGGERRAGKRAHRPSPAPGTPGPRHKLNGLAPHEAASPAPDDLYPATPAHYARWC